MIRPSYSFSSDLRMLYVSTTSSPFDNALRTWKRPRGLDRTQLSDSTCPSLALSPLLPRSARRLPRHLHKHPGTRARVDAELRLQSDYARYELVHYSWNLEGSPATAVPFLKGYTAQKCMLLLVYSSYDTLLCLCVTRVSSDG